MNHRDVRCLLMDVLSAVASLTGGISNVLTPLERDVQAKTDPTLEKSRFWVVGRRVGGADDSVLAWSPVKHVALAVAELASRLGLQNVTLVDIETDEEEQVAA